MAEIAIPMVILGGMYVLSNQNSEEKEEGFQANRTTPESRQNQALQNNVQPQNYPKWEKLVNHN